MKEYLSAFYNRGHLIFSREITQECINMRRDVDVLDKHLALFAILDVISPERSKPCCFIGFSHLYSFSRPHGVPSRFSALPCLYIDIIHIYIPT